jgi:cellulose synthase/poly-beta-1,6-N-acetylglucosamine synthase-like glycosyltransferase
MIPIDGAFEFVAGIVFVLGLSQILLALRCHLYLRSYETKSARRLRESFDPAVALICPCRGLDPNFEQNVRSMLALNYQAYRTFFVVSDPNDRAHRVLRSLTADHPNCRIVISDRVRSPGDKVNNLLAAVNASEVRSAELFAFIDSDVNPDPEWLRNLITPLVDPAVGLTTGYRHYQPVSGFWSTMRAVANNVAMTPHLVGHRLRVAWGGAMAMRRRDFDRSGVEEIWCGALSDDLTLATAIRRLGLRIEFVPKCLTNSSDSCTMRECYAWLRRQLFVARMYSPAMWRGAFFSFVPMLLIFAGIMLSPLSLAFPSLRMTAITLLMVLPLQVIGGWLTALVFKDYHTALWVPVGILFAGALSIAAFVHSAFARQLTWRGITYRFLPAGNFIVVNQSKEGGHMNGFRDADEARQIMQAVVDRMDRASLQNVHIVYSYRFTDIDWSFTLAIRGGTVQMFDGVLTESETTIELTSSVFDRILTGAMSAATAHFTDQARFRGSTSNIMTFGTLLPVLSQAYCAVKKARKSAEA